MNWLRFVSLFFPLTLQISTGKRDIICPVIVIWQGIYSFFNSGLDTQSTPMHDTEEREGSDGASTSSSPEKQHFEFSEGYT